MDISVIIVNYNVRQFLENALTSLYRALDGLSSEVFVVDNASDDGSPEMVRSKFPGVLLIENKENVGFARANNIALRRARGDYLLIINPDTIVQEDTLPVMVRLMRENPDIGAAGCKILNPDGSFQAPCRRSFPTPWVAFTKIFGLSTLFPHSRLFGRYNVSYLNPDESYEVDAVSGSFMMVSRRAYEKVGGLDESFFMYGEDLDWCYRIARAGFKVYYSHATKIIHFKGESTRRSDIDELTLFYRAMQQFVEKHFSRSVLMKSVLSLGIRVRAAAAFLARVGRPFLHGAIDFLLVDCAMILGEVLYFGQLFKFPPRAYPVVWIIPALIVVSTALFLGLYGAKRHSALRAAAAVCISYVIISALVFFAKDFAFSRAVVAISGVLSLLFLPGWRILPGVFGRRHDPAGGRHTLFGRHTLIVGTGPSAQEVLRKLRARIDGGFDIQGFIDLDRKRIGEKISGVEIVGSIDNVGKVIAERKIGEVIFSTDGLSYSDILSVIARGGGLNVNYRLVPNSLEAIIGKTHIEELDTLPLVEIDYNIHMPVNRFVKRLLDLCISGMLLLFVYPFLWIAGKMGTHHADGGVRAWIRHMPQVFRGRRSLVGWPDWAESMPLFHHRGIESGYLGPKGVTGLVQLNARDDMGPEEIERYLLYYAKNQSLSLDLAILAKSLRSSGKQRRR